MQPLWMLCLVGMAGSVTPSSLDGTVECAHSALVGQAERLKAGQLSLLPPGGTQRDLRILNLNSASHSVVRIGKNTLWPVA